MYSVIARNVKYIIRNQGVKQYVIARRAGLNEKTFNNMLNGRKGIVFGSKKEQAEHMLIITNIYL